MKTAVLSPTYLFGSYARNDHDDYSDLDILIVSDCECLASENKATLLFPQWDDRVSFSYYSPSDDAGNVQKGRSFFLALVS